MYKNFLKTAVKKAELSELVSIYEKAVKYLTQKGIDEKLVITNSMITPSCGAGGLDETLAEKAMNLTKLLSDNLKEKYSIDN